MDFAELLDLLGYTSGEHLSMCYQRPGEAFRSVVVSWPLPNLPMPDGQDMWFGVNPIHNVEKGRGGANDVTRLTAIWCDLDVKPGACRDLDHARQIVDELSALLGTRPSAVVMSGHGLQPYWPIDDGRIATEDLRAEAAAVLKRWGRLAVLVADSLGAAIDRGVYDLARVLRVPGTYNHKGEPVLVECWPDTGAPLTIDELTERLDEAGIPETDGDRGGLDLDTIVSAPSGWHYTNAACSYVHTMRKGWTTDSPADRHPWLVAQATRIACAHRNGCLTPRVHAELIDALEARFLQLCAQPGRERKLTSPTEVISALRHGQRIAAVKNEAGLASELGSHLHLDELAGKRGQPSPSGVTPSEVARPVPAAVAPPVAAAATPDPRAEAHQPDTEAPAASPELRAVRASTIATTVPEWAWTYEDKGRILKAAMTLFGGRPGAGKSTTGRWFAAGWTRGTLPGCFEGQPVNVAYIATEEAWHHTVVPSLQAAGADLDRIVFIQRGDDPARIKSIADETALAAIFRQENVRAAFLDPLMGTINGGADINRNNEVREYLDPWVRIAEAIDGPVIGICHMTKAPTGDVVASITGSSAFGELARCVFGFAIDREADDGTRVMSQAKNSAGIEGLSLAYKIGSQSVTTTDGKSADMARFELLGLSEKNVRELLLAERSQGMSSSTSDECTKWLKGYLAHHGPTMREDVADAATEVGFSPKVLKTAARKAGVIFERTRELPSRNMWSMPGATGGAAA